MFGPLYGRGRFSRANWNRNSLSSELLTVEMSDPVPECEESRSIEFARKFRNYGKPDYARHGLNFRLNEFTAALSRIPDHRRPR